MLALTVYVSIDRKKVKRRVNEGGLGLFDFSDFLTSLKLTLIKKVIDPNFAHYWKTIIFIKQLKFSENIEISIKKYIDQQ